MEEVFFDFKIEGNSVIFLYDVPEEYEKCFYVKPKFSSGFPYESIKLQREFEIQIPNFSALSVDLYFEIADICQNRFFTTPVKTIWNQEKIIYSEEINLLTREVVLGTASQKMIANNGIKFIDWVWVGLAMVLTALLVYVVVKYKDEKV